MTLYWMFDAAFPPSQAPPGAQAVLGYLGRPGFTPHVWTLPEWDRFSHLRQFPAWVPDFSRDPDSEAVSAVMAALGLGWAPHQSPARVIVFDLETRQLPGWYEAAAARVGAEGFTAVAYGSQSSVFGNAAAHVLAADWTNVAHEVPGETVVGTQYAPGPEWDWSVIGQWMWDRAGQGPRHG